MDTKGENEKDIYTTVTASKSVCLQRRLVELKELEIRVNVYPVKRVSQTEFGTHLMKAYHMERKVCFKIKPL